jgi:hypothetical protein
MQANCQIAVTLSIANHRTSLPTAAGYNLRRLIAWLKLLLLFGLGTIAVRNVDCLSSRTDLIRTLHSRPIMVANFCPQVLSPKL